MNQVVRRFTYAFSAILLFMFISLFVSRADMDENGGGDLPQYHIRIVCDDLNSDFFTAFIPGARQAEAELDVYVELVEIDKWEPNNVPWSVRKSIYYGADGIAFQESDPNKAAEMLDSVGNSNAVLLMYENDISQDLDILTVGTDAYMMGYEAGRLAIEAADGDCRAVLIIDSTRFDSESTQDSLRLQGVLDAFAETADAHLVEAYPLGDSVMSGDVLVTALLDEEVRATYNTIICLNERVTSLLGQRLLYYGLFREISLIGRGSGTQTLDYINRGIIYASLCPDAYEVGYQTVANLVAALDGEAPQSWQSTGITTITRQNVIDFLLETEAQP